MKESVSIHSARSWRRVACALLVTCGLPAALAFAQAPSVGDPTANGFDLTVGLGARRTSNSGLAADDQLHEADSIGDLRAQFTGHRRSPRTEWAATYNPFYTRYGSNSQFDSLNHVLNLDARYAMTPHGKLGLLERFSSTRDLSVLDSAEAGGETVILTRLTRRWRNFADAAFDLGLSRTLSLQVGASSRIERFDEGSRVDSSMESGRLGIKKQVGRKDGIITTYGYSRFDFGDAGVDAAEAQGVDLSWSHGIPGRTDFMLAAGVSRVSRGPDTENRLTSSASLHHPFRRLDFVSGFRRGLGADSGVANVTVSQDAYAAISGRIGQRASISARGEYGTRDSVLEGGDRLSLDYAGGALLGSVTLNPHVSISGEARRRSQNDTGGAGEDLKVNTFALRLDFRIF